MGRSVNDNLGRPWKHFAGTTTSTAVAVPCVVKQLSITGTTGNAITVRDGGGAGTTKFTIRARAGNGQSFYFGEGGVRFSTDVHVTVGGTAPKFDVTYAED